MQLFWKETRSISPGYNKKLTGDTSLCTVATGSPWEMYQGFPGDPDSGSRGSSSPSIESQYLSSVDSFGSPPTTSAPQECVSAGAGLSIVSTGPGTSVGGEMPGSFVPTVTAITTSQDLQWMVQPTLISSQASGQSASTATSTMTQPVSLVDPYDLPGTSYSSGSGMTPMASDTAGPGPVRQSRARSRRTRDVSVSEDGDVGVLLTPEEEEKRRVRRERNKLAAAKCRNRRRELTDRLQSETDILEEEKAELEAEISELQKEKERLEFVLVAHQPNCKLVYQEQPSQSSIQVPGPTLQGPVSIVGLTMKEDSFYLPPAYSTHPASAHSQPAVQQQQVQQAPQPGLMQEVEFSSSFYGSSEPAPGGPCLMASDSGGGNHDGAAIGYNTSYTSSFVFTYPEGACGVSANQRNSSSEQSSDSLNSPSLLAL
ncbi:protein fosB isoform X1 [Periophthalmus magnuspinnatus]|uniref:protein fosB isoform X1 n=2 Tax=Periophthalmus magnuspinnatus TaxID=409849 RepID=UPI00145ACD4E|nr:protein fosB isoform X1 [Periophthalmus magnuspinnatus]